MASAPNEPLRFEDVAGELTEPLERYLRRFVGDRHVAEDLLQETLLKISNRLSSFEGRSSLKTWALRVATRTAIDSLRANGADSRIETMEDVETLSGDDDQVGGRIVIDEMNSCVREVIDGLPEDYRAAIILHDLEGLTAAETAEIGGCSVATAKIRIHRARARLKRALERECTFYHDHDQTLRCDRRTPDGTD